MQPAQAPPALPRSTPELRSVLERCWGRDPLRWGATPAARSMILNALSSSRRRLSDVGSGLERQNEVDIVDLNASQSTEGAIVLMEIPFVEQRMFHGCMAPGWTSMWPHLIQRIGIVATDQQQPTDPWNPAAPHVVHEHEPPAGATHSECIDWQLSAAAQQAAGTQELTPAQEQARAQTVGKYVSLRRWKFPAAGVQVFNRLHAQGLVEAGAPALPVGPALVEAMVEYVVTHVLAPALGTSGAATDMTVPDIDLDATARVLSLTAFAYARRDGVSIRIQAAIAGPIKLADVQAGVRHAFCDCSAHGSPAAGDHHAHCFATVLCRDDSPRQVAGGGAQHEKLCDVRTESLGPGAHWKVAGGLPANLVAKAMRECTPQCRLDLGSQRLLEACQAWRLVGTGNVVSVVAPSKPRAPGPQALMLFVHGLNPTGLENARARATLGAHFDQAASDRVIAQPVMGLMVRGGCVLAPTWADDDMAELEAAARDIIAHADNIAASQREQARAEARRMLLDAPAASEGAGPAACEGADLIAGGALHGDMSHQEPAGDAKRRRTHRSATCAPSASPRSVVDQAGHGTPADITTVAPEDEDEDVPATQPDMA